MDGVPVAIATASLDARPHGENNVMFADQEVTSAAKKDDGHDQEAKPVQSNKQHGQMISSCADD